MSPLRLPPKTPVPSTVVTSFWPGHADEVGPVGTQAFAAPLVELTVVVKAPLGSGQRP